MNQKQTKPHTPGRSLTARLSRASLPVLLLVTCQTFAQSSQSAGASADEEPIENQPTATAAEPQLEIYTAPKSKDIKTPRFPKSNQMKGREGWVQLGFMVDAQGQTYEIDVIESTGDRDFEQAAIRALKRSEFIPAQLDGQTLDAGSVFKYTFALSGNAKGASRPFVGKYRQLIEAVQEGDRDNADKQLTRLNETTLENLYEDAYLNFGRYVYYQRWGTEAQQLQALNRAIAYEDDAKFLPQETYIQALLASFVLNVKRNDFIGALSTRERLVRQPIPDEQRVMLDQVAEKIQALKTADNAFEVSGIIDNSANWWHRLLKKTFQFDQVEGEIAEIKLRCSTDYVFFRFDPQKSYRIAESMGDCTLQVIGNPGTTFILVQS